uniref:Uncharacterized protein n=1 Tax=Onchocerca volvulus TaxID=6282 RepID=A0A8R1TJW2_ONCVO
MITDGRRRDESPNGLHDVRNVVKIDNDEMRALIPLYITVAQTRKDPFICIFDRRQYQANAKNRISRSVREEEGDRVPTPAPPPPPSLPVGTSHTVHTDFPHINKFFDNNEALLAFNKLSNPSYLPTAVVTKDQKSCSSSSPIHLLFLPSGLHNRRKDVTNIMSCILNL